MSALTPFRSLTRSNRSIAGSRNGVALLVVLAFVILLSILVTSFLSFSGLDRLSTASYSKSIQAQEIAQGGLQDIIADLHQEIVAGSIPDPNGTTYTQGTAPNTVTIYVPSTNITASPPRLGYAPNLWAYGPTAAPATAPATLLPTLVQVSRADPNGAKALVPALNTAIYSNLAALPNGAIYNRASLASTGTSSVNGRYISAARWNKPFLLASSTALLPTPFYGGETLPTASYPGTPDLPDWVYTTRVGSLACKQSDLPNMIPSNNPSTTYAAGTPSPVVGRYAYVIYDEGALLDANVAGSPTALMNNSIVTNPVPLYTNSTSATPPTPTSLAFNGKSYTSFADLMQLYGFAGGGTTAQTAIDNLVKFRNAGGIANANASYGNGIAGSTFLGALFGYAQNGFLNFQSNTTVPATDSPFLNRQDLINYFTKIDSNINTSTATFSQALPYLGTFSRAVSAPSYFPPLDPANIPGYQGTLVTANPVPTYHTSMESSGMANRDLANVRFSSATTITHYIDDQTSATPTSTYNVNAGDPLLQNRFSLVRIGWLSSKDIGGMDGSGTTNPATGNGPSAQFATAIQACFGLKWGNVGGTIANGGNPCWLYVGSSGGNSPVGTIETLDQVATENREPNFFELLKAAILSGSVGVSPGPAGWNNGVGFPNGLGTPYTFKDNGLYVGGTDSLNAYSFDRVAAGSVTLPAPASMPDVQIMRIGANIIDQYDADSYPTAIYFPFSGKSSQGISASMFPNSNYDAKNFTEYSSSSGTQTGDISGPSDMIYGCENLPVLQGVYKDTATADAAGNPLDSWWQMEVWNPYQEPLTANLTTIQKNSVPTSYRVRGYGQSFIYWLDGGPLGPPHGFTTQPFMDNMYIDFTDSSPTSSIFYSNPVILNTALGSTVSVSAGGSDATILPHMTPTGVLGYTSNPFVGFWMGEDSTYIPNPDPAEIQSRGQTNAGVTFCLGWTSGTGAGAKFHPYSYLCQAAGYSYSVLGQNDGSDTEHGTAEPSGASGGNDEFHVYVDSRTSRFSQIAGWASGFADSTMYPSSAADSQYHPSDQSRQGSPMGINFIYAPGGYNLLNDDEEDWAVNQAVPASVTTPATATYYADPDGVVRPGDGQYGNPGTGDGMVLFTSAGSPSNPSSTTDSGNVQNGRRPVILNRPFRSVGELGYVFRDLPFKTLDFFSPSSADAALLDVFSLTDESKVGDSRLGSVIAGQVTLSNAPLPVLEAILSGGSKKDLDSTWNFGNEGGTSPVPFVKIATAMATSMTPSSITSTNPGPLLGRASLVTQISQAVAKTSFFGTTASETSNFQFGAHDSADKANKAYLEGPLRSLASVTNTRTWNLMIDIIAQSGQMSPTATKLDNFVVQGERRYWLHVAIDRYTGKIVAQQLEPVYE